MVACNQPAQRHLKNVTITLDEVTAGWARVHAAQRNVSMSRFVGELLEQNMRQSREYDEAMRRFLARRPVRLKREGERYPNREEIHDRPGLR
jgi:hypothetical protein